MTNSLHNAPARLVQQQTTVTTTTTTTTTSAPNNQQPNVTVAFIPPQFHPSHYQSQPPVREELGSRQVLRSDDSLEIELRRLASNSNQQPPNVHGRIGKPARQNF